MLGFSQNNCCLECTNAKTALLVRLRRLRSSAEEGTSPAIRLEMMTANELRAKLLIAQQENKSLRSQVMRLARSSKVIVIYRPIWFHIIKQNRFRTPGKPKGSKKESVKLSALQISVYFLDTLSLLNSWFSL